VLDPRMTYRSQLGRLDPLLTVTDSLDRRTFAQVVAQRGTFSNDAWIWSDLVNSAEFLLLGHDSRNYFRASRAEATVARRWEGASWTLEPRIGGRVEKSSSVRPDTAAQGGPFSFLGRKDRDDRLRANPAVEGGRIASGLAGIDLQWEDQGIVAHARADVEVGRWSDGNRIDSASATMFGQTTIDGTVTFPTFGLQTFRFDAHAVFTSHGTTPRQRWAYLGGPGSLPTLDLLELGGDQLLYFDARYNIPITAIALPLVGSPVFTLREAVGGAAPGRIPTLQQATGFRVSLSVIHVEFLVDPVRHRSHTGFGISIAR
jgi:hypothetical protein